MGKQTSLINVERKNKQKKQFRKIRGNAKIFKFFFSPELSILLPTHGTLAQKYKLSFYFNTLCRIGPINT